MIYGNGCANFDGLNKMNGEFLQYHKTMIELIQNRQKEYYNTSVVNINISNCILYLTV